MTLPLSDHFNGKTFFNRDHVDRTLRDVLHWQRTRRPTPWPAHVPLAPQPPPPQPSERDFVVTWIGHATFLIQTTRGNFLTDPNFSERCGPFGWFGPRRVQPPAIALRDLPRIDTVLLSHDHYDHCDLASLRAIARAHDPVVVTPLGNAALAARAGLRRTAELDWWQTHSPAAGVEVTLTPARHWSNRLSGRRNARLWGGFMVEFSIFDSRFSIGAGVRPPLAEGTEIEHRGPSEATAAPEIENRESKIENRRRLWFAGDTGYDAVLFHEIRRRLGAPALALIPIGAYEPRWFMAAQHCNPAEAVQIHRDVGAGVSLAMHWGTWQLTDEGREEPVRALAEALAAEKIAPDAFRALSAGETVVNRAAPAKVGGTPAGIRGST